MATTAEKPPVVGRLGAGFRNGWLLLRRVEWSSKTTGFQAPPAPAWTEDQFHCCDNEGHASSWSQARSVALPSRLDASLPLRKAIFHWADDVARPSTALLPLDSVNLAVLFERKSDRLQTFRKTLIRDVFHAHDPLSIFAQSFISITYIEPMQELLNAEHSRDELVSLIKRLRTELDQSDSVAIPQLFEDLIVFPGSFGPGIDRDLLVIRRTPIVYSEAQQIIPKSVLELAELLSMTPRLNATLKRLKDTRMLRDGTRTYLQSLIQELAPESGAVRDRSLATVYQRHLNDRAEIADAYQSARMLALDHAEATRAFERNAERVGDDWLWSSTLLHDSSYRYGLIASLRGKLARVGAQIRTSVSELEARNGAVSDYLRDFFNAEVAQSNMRLQRTVYRLTIVALLIALLPLLIELMNG